MIAARDGDGFEPRLDSDGRFALPIARRCFVCGCTESKACVAALLDADGTETDVVCFWSTPNLCSFCLASAVAAARYSTTPAFGIPAIPARDDFDELFVGLADAAEDRELEALALDALEDELANERFVARMR